MIPQMDKIAGKRSYLFMQDGARAHTAKDTMELLNDQDFLIPLTPEMWPPNSPDLNPVDYCIWAELERRVYRGRIITTLDELRKAIITEWNRFPQAIINASIDSFRKRLEMVVKNRGRHIEKY